MQTSKDWSRATWIWENGARNRGVEFCDVSLEKTFFKDWC
jgi:hypothetical protein